MLKEVLSIGMADLMISENKGIVIDVSSAAFSEEHCKVAEAKVAELVATVNVPQNSRLALIHNGPEEQRSCFRGLAVATGIALEFFSSLNEAKFWIDKAINHPTAALAPQFESGNSIQ